MAKQYENEKVSSYYYDLHPTVEDLMGETAVHRAVVTYLTLVLQWLFREQHCAIFENLNFYQTSDFMEYPLAPDIAVIKGVDMQNLQDIPSWKVGETGPPPHVVFEFASKETWGEDLEKKPMKYGLMGVREYFAYDPNPRTIKRKTSRRLWGWQLARGSNEMQEIPVRPDGSLWSQHLESFLVPDKQFLRLYDNTWHLRLTQAEAEAQRAEEEAQARHAAEMQAQMEAQARHTAEMQAQMEAQARHTAEKRVEALAEKLRSLGIDPDKL
jgi:Uma2 family endonuclease